MNDFPFLQMCHVRVVSLKLSSGAAEVRSPLCPSADPADDGGSRLRPLLPTGPSAAPTLAPLSLGCTRFGLVLKAKGVVKEK